MRESERCGATSKRRYRDHAQAVAALHKFQRVSTRDRVPARVYECTACHGWHLTAQPVWETAAQTRTRGARRRPS